MICEACLDFYIVPSRLPRLCKKCESEVIAEAAKQVDEKSLSLGQVAVWIQSGERPHRLARVWWCW